jgi:hypothetical protein
MTKISSNLVIELDEAMQSLKFTVSKKNGVYSSETAAFSIDIDLLDLKNRGADGAEKLIGECVLGFFDRLTNGSLDLPKHY